MLTTTVDGLWVLQVLTGIEVVAPELGLRPHLPSVETPAVALSHPITRELRQAGVVTGDGDVDDVVVEWLTVLSRKDAGLLIYAQTPAAASAPERVLLARFAHWWVALERSGIVIRISGAGSASNEDSAAGLIHAQIDRLCGELAPANLRPVTIDVAALLAGVHDRASLRSFLTESRLDADQVATLLTAADPERSAQASILALQFGVPEVPGRAYIDPGAVTIIDTPAGRLVGEHVSSVGKRWMIVGPGGPRNITAAALTMMRRLPSQQDWHSHRKVV